MQLIPSNPTERERGRLREQETDLSVDDDLYGRATSAVAFAFRDTARGYTQSDIHKRFHYDPVSGF